MIDFVIGTVAGQFAGAWVSWRIRRRAEWIRRTSAGLVTAVVATGIYLPLRVHTWAGGEGASRALSPFLGVCIGICQGVLWRGRPLARTRIASGNSK